MHDTAWTVGSNVCTPTHAFPSYKYIILLVDVNNFVFVPMPVGEWRRNEDVGKLIGCSLNNILFFFH